MSEPEKTQEGHVPVVVIGASAGGLEPCEEFFGTIRDGTGFAFVVIQHLSPDFESVMDELLARHSGMKINRITDGMPLAPNSINLNVPRSSITLKDGRFAVAELEDPSALHLPIDIFLHSLASERGKASIAIILSGTGSDGTKGARAIMEAGGTVLVQDKTSAKFDGMPVSVLNSGQYTVSASPQALAIFVDRISAGETIQVAQDGIATASGQPIDMILSQLLDAYKTDFRDYKQPTVRRRISRRAFLLGMSMVEYAQHILDDEDEASRLYGDLLIEVTSFFRDKDAFDEFYAEVLPTLVEQMTQTRPIRIWVPGCASGEEVYSLAIQIAEYARQAKRELNIKILATDIHGRSLDAASAGIYPQSALSSLSPELVNRYFDELDGRYQIKSFLRAPVVFSLHDLLRDAPFTRIDLVSCRNVLIYFNDTAQQKALSMFHFSLTPNGFLFLGPSETVGKLAPEFKMTSRRWRIYQKTRNVQRPANRLAKGQGIALPSVAQRRVAARVERKESAEKTELNRERRHQIHALEQMMRRHAPPGFLLSREGKIEHIFGDAGSYLNQENGSFSNRIQDLLTSQLRLIVNSGLQQLSMNPKSVFERVIEIDSEQDEQKALTISMELVEPVADEEPLVLMVLEAASDLQRPVNFDAIEPSDGAAAVEILQARIHELEADLATNAENLQSTVEELETTNEELQSTNEEMMAANEELQSTNEELHSVNEELYTVSSEHQRRVEELLQSTDDMNLLMTSTDIGIIFLDEALTVRKFTPPAQAVFNIMAQDTERPISHITNHLTGFDLVDEIETVRQSGVQFEREVMVKNRLFQLRVLPYRSAVHEIMGAVITTVDISHNKRLEQEHPSTST